MAAVRAAWVRSVLFVALVVGLLALPSGVEAQEAPGADGGGAAGVAVSSGFSDVGPSHPFREAIAWLVSEEITTGYADGTFRPGAPITRQAMSAFLHRFGQSTSTAQDSAFSDVSGANPFVAAIEWMAFREITTGYADGTFRPGAPISRQAMAAFLQRFWAPTAQGEPAGFSDVSAQHPFAAEIGWLAGSGVTTGYADGSFRPSGTVTRQAMAAFLWRLAGEPAVGDPGVNRVDVGDVRVLAVDEVAGVSEPDWESEDGAQPTTLTFGAGASLPSVGELVLVEVSEHTPLGASGRVVSVDAPEVVLEPVPMDLLVARGEVGGTSSGSATGIAVDGAGAAGPMAASQGLQCGSADVFLDVDPLFDLKVLFEASWGVGGLQTMQFGFEAQAGLGATATVVGGLTCEADFEVFLSGVRLPPIPLGVLGSAVPVVGGAGELRLNAGVSVSATGHLAVVVEAGVVYQDGELVPYGDAELSSEFELNPIDEWLGGSAEVFSGVKLGLLWANSVGVFVTSGPVVDLEVTPFADEVVSITAAWRWLGTANLNLWFLGRTEVPIAQVDLGGRLVLSTPAVRVTQTELLSVIPGQAYAQRIEAEGGVPFSGREPLGPYDVNLLSGDLPPGLLLGSDGEITGTLDPDDADDGPWDFTVEVIDRVGLRTEADLSIEVATLTIGPPTLPAVVPGAAYSVQLSASGGVEPYEFELLDGDLPSGLTLDADGLLSGTITAQTADDGPWDLTVRVTDADGATGQRTYTLEVALSTIEITPSTAPAATVDEPYSLQLSASGGVEPYEFDLAAGDLPPGLTLSTNGLIAGTIAVEHADDGPWTFTVRATDAGASTGQIELTITAHTTNPGEAVQIAAGSAHTCAVLDDGTARCWGDNSSGQLGDGSTIDRWTPVAVSGLSGVTQIAAGDAHTCAVLGDGTARCWGSNEEGRLGDGSTTDRLTPVAVSGLSSATQITAGTRHTCALLADGTARCWGGNVDGTLGDGSTIDRWTPVAVSGLSGATQVAAAEGETCAVLGDGTVRCWGWPDLTPVTVSGLSGVTQIALGYGFSCVLLGDGTARCWGVNSLGQLGDGTTQHRETPVAVSGLSSATQISVGGRHACALLEDATARCWGGNLDGELGDGSDAGQLTPVAVSGLSGATQVTTGWGHTCSVLGDGTVLCWGNNEWRQLGDGTDTNRSTPVGVVGLSSM